MGECSYSMVTSIKQNDGVQIRIIVLLPYILVQIGKTIIGDTLHLTYSDVNDTDTRFIGLKFLHNTVSFLIYSVVVIAGIFPITKLLDFAQKSMMLAV